MMVIIVISSLLILLALGTPVAFSLAISALLGIVYVGGIEASVAVSDIIWGTVSEFVLVAIPLFVLMSEIINSSGVGKDLFRSVDKWFCRLPGGIAISAIVAGAIFGAVSGTAVGVAAVIGSVAIPEMMKRNYSGEMSSGTVAASSGLGMVIPPSLPLIMYGVVTETSIADLFSGALVPGIVIVLMMCGYVIFVSMKERKFHGDVKVELHENLSFVRSLLLAGPVIFLIIVVIGSIYNGVATPTEAAAIGVFGALVISALKGSLSVQTFSQALVKSTKTNCMLLAILAFAMVFSYALSNAQVPQHVAEMVISAELNKWTFFIIVMVMLFFLGMLLDAISLVIIAIPIIFPAMIAYGFDPIWLGVVVMVNMCFAVITPPVGLCLYVVRDSVVGLTLAQVIRGTIPFIVLYAVAIAVLSVFPSLTAIY
ncbi:TRAP transporter large permease [Marinobacterium iners]|uniref:TRAP transporter large permease protein n=1 Tax=Marinobacterium iners DSM 11526 TaxID=1122198 RepID=A0A1H3XT47_9GAMM|nr:TRAP transporter large permease subunit [Marinobacterium iners]SEA02556.1 C4-dicarboxylate transporter, DctM subunit [Marinobacterium iners DSM 11526]